MSRNNAYYDERVLTMKTLGLSFARILLRIRWESVSPLLLLKLFMKFITDSEKYHNFGFHWLMNKTKHTIP